MKQQRSSIDINGFIGMNTVKNRERFLSEGNVAEPRIIVNSDVTVESSLVRRDGMTKKLDFTNAHSLWAGSMCMLVVDNGVLCRVQQGELISVADINSVDVPVYFTEVEDVVYFSSRSYCGIFDPVNNTVSSWGISVPESPVLLAGSGGLRSGTYHVVMTNVVGGKLSGTSGIGKIVLDFDDSGIQILNRPQGAIVWCTDADEGIFYRVGAQNKIVNIPTVEPCPTLFCSPPIFAENICVFCGRMWGSRDNVLYYSQPFRYDLFRLNSDKFEFDSNITLIAVVPSGIFVGMEDKTVFLDGTEPEKMQVINAGAGSISGTLVYCNNLPELGNMMVREEKGYVDVPVWRTVDGIVAGNVQGRLFNLTKNSLSMGKARRGASLYRTNKGAFQFITSSKIGDSGSGVQASDEAVCEVFRNGKLIT